MADSMNDDDFKNGDHGPVDLDDLESYEETEYEEDSYEEEDDDDRRKKRK